MNNSYKTHNTFFRVITYNRLNELYRRADPQYNILKKAINRVFISNKRPFYCTVNIRPYPHINKLHTNNK